MVIACIITFIIIIINSFINIVIGKIQVGLL